MVPPDEIERRLKGFRAALRADGLAGALVVQDVDLYYLAGRRRAPT